MAIQLPILSTFDNRGVKKARSSIGNLTKAVVGFGIAAGAAFAIRGVSNFTKEAVSSASDLSESLNAVAVSFGEASEAVIKLGEDSASRLGVAQSAFNNAAVRFSAFAGTVVGEGGDVAGFIDDVTTRATDFASVFNIDVAEALQVFQSGLAGEAEPLKRFGINLLQAEVEAYALREGIIAVGESMTEQEKVQARYGLLMESTAQTAGDFANTSDGLANQQRILSAEFEQIRAEIGTALLPVFEELNGFILDNVIPTLKRFAEEDFPILIDNMRERASEIQPIFEEIEQSIRESFNIDPDTGILESFFESLGDTVSSEDLAETLTYLIEGFAEMLPDLIELVPLMVDLYAEIIPALVAILPGFTRLVAGLVGIFGPSEGGLAWGIKNARDEFFNFEEDFWYLNPSIRGAASEMDATFREWYGNIASVFNLAEIEWPAAFTGTWENIKFVFFQSTRGIREEFGIWGDNLVTYLMELGPRFYETAVETMQSLWDGFVEKFTEIAAWFEAKPQEIKDFFADLPGEMNTIGLDIFTGLWDGLKSKWTEIENWAGETFTGFKNFIKDIFDIDSPSKVMKGIGENIVDGFLIGLNSSQPELNTTMKGLVEVPDGGMTPGAFGSGAGTYYNITVQAGVGDPVRIGEEVVTAIKRYERVSGPVFASA